MRNPYLVLGVSPADSPEKVKKCYRELSVKWHPDINKETNATRVFAEIASAYEILSDSAKKMDFDRNFSKKQIENLSDATQKVTQDFIESLLKSR